MDIKEWQQKFVHAIKNRFPNEWTKEQRLLAIYRQLADVSGAIAVSGGTLKCNLHGYENVDHAIACVFADLFMLAEQIDLEKELGEVLCWLETVDKKAEN